MFFNPIGFLQFLLTWKLKKNLQVRFKINQGQDLLQIQKNIK